MKDPTAAVISAALFLFLAIGVVLGWTWNILADVLRMALCTT